MTKTLVETINSSIDYVSEALRFVSRDKVFVAWNGKTIEKFFKTKKSAETYIANQQNHTYYDDYSQTMITCGSSLMIDCIICFDLVDFYNDKSIWYKEMKRNRTHSNNMDMVIREAARIGVSEEVIEFLDEIREEFAQNNSFTIFPELEDKKNIETEIEVVTNEECNNTVVDIDMTLIDESIVIEKQDSENMEIEVLLNDDKKGIELYFDGKPDEIIRINLKQNGFRWSNRGKFWYAKQNEKTFNFVKSLTGHTIDRDSHQQKLKIETVEEVEDINIDDLDKYIVSDSLQDRLHSRSMFNYDHKQGCINMFKSINDNAYEIIKMTNDSNLIYQIKSYSQNFKSKYYSLYIQSLEREAITPNWMVTGRGNLNVNRYNKKQEQLANINQKFVDMGEKHGDKMMGFKNKAKKLLTSS